MGLIKLLEIVSLLALLHSYINSSRQHQTALMLSFIDLVRRQEELRKMEETHQREMQMKLEMRFVMFTYFLSISEVSFF